MIHKIIIIIILNLKIIIILADNIKISDGPPLGGPLRLATRFPTKNFSKKFLFFDLRHFCRQLIFFQKKDFFSVTGQPGFLFLKNYFLVDQAIFFQKNIFISLYVKRFFSEKYFFPGDKPPIRGVKFSL